MKRFLQQSNIEEWFFLFFLSSFLFLFFFFAFICICVCGGQLPFTFYILEYSIRYFSWEILQGAGAVCHNLPAIQPNFFSNEFCPKCLEKEEKDFLRNKKKITWHIRNGRKTRKNDNKRNKPHWHHYNALYYAMKKIQFQSIETTELLWKAEVPTIMGH